VSDEYETGEALQDQLELSLIELGGQDLLDRAHDEAGAYVESNCQDLWMKIV
jgi:hypothetical protein